MFDFGGGTFDVTIVEIKDNKYTVKATGGDNHLGGEDLDAELVKYAAEEFKKATGKDITGNHKSMNRLRLAAE